MACIFYLYCVYSFFYALSAITGSQPMTRSTTPSQTIADTAPLQNTPSILHGTILCWACSTIRIVSSAKDSVCCLFFVLVNNFDS